MSSPDYSPVQQNEHLMEFENKDMKMMNIGSTFSPTKRSLLKPVLIAVLIITPWVILGISTFRETSSTDCANQRIEKLNTDRNVYYDKSAISREKRYAALNQKGCTVWFTGLSGSGKSTIGKEIERELLQRRKHVYRLDGDNVRTGLNRDLDFSPSDRAESVRRVGELAALFSESGTITLVALVSPYQHHRDKVRELHLRMGIPFVEVFVDVPLEVVKKRDPKGLYDRAVKGEIKDFTGISAPYEPPINPEIHIKSAAMSINEEVSTVLSFLESHGYLVGSPNIPVGYPGIALLDGKKNVDIFDKLADDHSQAPEIPVVLVRDEDLHWVQIIGEGWASPLRGFMKEGVYLQSLHFSSILFDEDNLTDGALNIAAGTNFSDYTCNVATGKRISMPVPIVLPINEATKSRIEGHNRIILAGPAGEHVAEMFDLEIFDHRKEERIARTFGAYDPDHPYVASIMNSGNFLIGGEIRLIDRIKYNDGLDKYRLTPKELRNVFREMNADVVLAFQTRNPVHSGHSYLMNSARQRLLNLGFKNPVLWLSPLSGWSKADDVPLDVRIRQHEAIIKEGMLDTNTTVMSLWPSPMIYAGPREVQWHAKSRKNAGASYFVVGRDPAGIKYSDSSVQKDHDIYSADHGRYVLHMAPGMENMNIISFPKVYYDIKDHKMKPRDEGRPGDFLSISGSKMRKMARMGLTPCKTIPQNWEENPTCVPPGFMSQSGWEIVVDYYQHINSSDWIPYSRQFVNPKIAESSKISTLTSLGKYGKTDFKLLFHNVSTGKVISPWHDIPLMSDLRTPALNVYNFIVEIPMGTMAKMEVNKETKNNPIMQDVQKRGISDVPRFYKYGIPFFNYGLFPQTWEDPGIKDQSGHGGDNDPLDVIELGNHVFEMGSIVPVKVLGSLELIDQDEVDHKILVLALSDPESDNIHSISDLNEKYPGKIRRLVDWLLKYKIPEGKSQNELSQPEPLSILESETIIQQTHQRWKALVGKKGNSTHGFWLH